MSEKEIRYSFLKGEHFLFEYVISKDGRGNTDTESWDKYGKMTPKTEQRLSGLYIMANDGVLSALDNKFSELWVAKGIRFTKVQVKSAFVTVIITIKNEEPNIIDYETTFTPPNRNLQDYFLKVSSAVAGDEFYHDMNGYLVSKRKIGFRPDYEWKYKPFDKINANTYPACSFAYILQDHKKVALLLFSLSASSTEPKESPLTTALSSSTSIGWLETTTRGRPKATSSRSPMSSGTVSESLGRRMILRGTGRESTMTPT